MEMASSIDVSRFLEDLSGQYARRYNGAVSDLIVAEATKDAVAHRAARGELARLTTETMGVGEVLGAMLMLRSADRGGSNFREPAGQTLLPSVTFEEAVQDMVERAPTTLQRPAQRTAQRISQLYSEGRVVAFAKSAEQAVTVRVQKLITQAMREGLDEVAAGRLIKMEVAEIRERTADWSEAYSRMAFRTNVNTAVTAGRFRQAQDPEVRTLVPCFRFDSVADADTRHNHARADGIVLRVDNQAWNFLAPPLGHNCRCQVIPVSIMDLRRQGRIRDDGSIIEDRVPQGAGPDANFRHGGRPDLFIVEAAG